METVMRLFCFVCIIVGSSVIWAMDTAFTYQGRLHVEGDPAEGPHDVQFQLFDDAAAGSQVGATCEADGLDIKNGYFTVTLDFGADAFDGSSRWLQVSVRPTTSTNPADYVPLLPRQAITPAPYAMYAANGPSPKLPLVLLHDGDEAVVWAENGAAGQGLFGSSVQGFGVHGMSASQYGIYGTGSKGVYGLHLDSGNFGYLGSSDFGVYGRFNNGNYGALGVSNAGVFGETNGADISGVFGSSPFGYGVRGASASRYGVYGTGAYGVRGEHPNSGNFGYLGSSDFGVYGRFNNENWGALGLSFAGVYGETQVQDAPAILGSSPFGYGVHGASATRYGVYGTGAIGVYAEHPSSGNYVALAGKDYLVDARNSSNSIAAVLGAYKTGVSTYSYVPGGYGVHAVGECGVFAMGDSLTGYGVKANGYYGVHAESTEGFAGYFDGAVRIIGYRWNPATTNGDFSIGDGAYWFKIGVAVGGGGAGDVRLRSQGGTNRLILGSGTEDVMTVVNGGVGIRTLNPAPDAALDVQGPIYQRGTKLHADYVFEAGYPLESIEEHAEIMWAQKHLPAIPAARRDEMGQEIIEVGAHQRGIVEELEKAHIYIEQLGKQNKELAEQNSDLTERLTRLENLVDRLSAEREAIQ